MKVFASSVGLDTWIILILILMLALFPLVVDKLSRVKEKFETIRDYSQIVQESS